MAKFMLIGGGNVGRGNTPYETKNIDKEVVKLTGKEHPNFLFVGLASSFSDSYYDTMKKIYKELGCDTVYLKKKNILNNPDIVKDKIEKADIIYFCGGDSVKLVNDLKEYNIIPLLENAINKGTVICGMSAGAIMLSKEGYSDSLIIRNESDKYEFISGLGFLNICFCPHYEEKSQKAEELKIDLEKSAKKVLALENCSAIKIVNDTYEIISENNNNAYLCYYQNSEYKKESINKKGMLKDLSTN